MREALMEKMAGEIALSKQVGQTMRKWRETFQFSQSELAAHLGVNPSVISDYESGRRKSPGIGTVCRMVHALLDLDAQRGGHVLNRYKSLLSPTEGIVAIGEYPRNIAASAFVQSIEGEVLVPARIASTSLQGYTLIDAVKAISTLNANDYVRVYGWSTERALLFSGIKYGRSPMIAIRVHPMKPSMVVYHNPEDVDRLAYKLAEVEQIPLVVTRLELPELRARLHGMA
jgi:putative transcriptional regulator